MCERELVAGSRCDVDRGAVVRLAGVLVAGVAVAARVVGLLVTDEEKLEGRGLGVTLLSADGKRVFLWAEGAGVLVIEGLGLRSGAEASDIGGEGGSCTGLPAGNSAVSGGVEMRGELAVDSGEPMLLSKVGDSGTEMSVEIIERWRDSCLRTLCWRTSTSILVSASSSFRRWVSMRRFSRSCSPMRISSSSRTPRSIATLYLDSRSSKDDVVFRA